MASWSRRASVCGRLAVFAWGIVGLGGSTLMAHDMHVAINEINYHPYGHIDDQEFVELYNRGTEAVDLSAWRFNQGIDFVFPAGTIIQPGAYLVVAKNASAVASLYGISNVIGPFDGKLANEGEMIQLVNSKGILIERIFYSDEDPWTTLADGEGPSLERISTQEAGDRPWNWADARIIGGTPGQPNSVNSMAVPPRDVVVNEISSSMGGGWIELYNRGPTTVNLAGYGLTCEPFRSAIYTIPASASVTSGGYWSVSESALPFALPDDNELHVSLLTPDGRLIDSLNFQTRAASGSFGRFPDGSDNTYVMISPTRDTANTVALNNSVVFNEIMYHPAAPTVPAGQPLLPYNRNEEYLELHNRTGALVDLTGWSLTGGVDYDFPAGTQIAAHGYLVVARDPATVMAKYGLTQGVVGGYTNVLADGHERLTLRDTLHNPVDEVTYADDGGWPTSPDGQGPSLELINADMENNAAVAWRPSSATGGTPGAANSILVADPPPVILNVRHNPPVPTSGQQVTVTAKVTDPGGVATVRLWSVVDPGTNFTSTDMLDDGAHGDGAANDGVYGATLPARAANSIVRFYIEATDNQAHGITAPVFPPNYARAAASDPTFLYQVDDRTWTGDLPLYRVIMTAANLNTLRSRDLYSNVDLDATFVSGNTITYNVGFRYRGQGSRGDAKKSYRIQFHDEAPLGNLEDLNLNAHNPHQQFIGQEFFSYVNLPVHRTRVVLLTLNNDLDETSLSDPNTYVQVESVNESYLERVFGKDDSGGNLYRADQNGDLSYLDTNPDSYRNDYLKETNDDLDDFSDLITFLNLLNNTPDAQFADVVRANVDIDEWMRYFAGMTVVTNDEGGICLDSGDDYFLYHRPSDGRWLLVPWDFDSVWDLSSTRSQPDQRIFRAGINDAGQVTLPIVRRILRHPDFAPIYYREIQQMMAYSFSPAIMADRITNLRRYSPRFAAADIDDVDSFVTQRRAFLNTSMPTDLTVSLDEASRPRVDYIKDGDTWKFFRGTAEPSTTALAWTQINFTDTAWESGPSGFGYADSDDRTTLSNMQNNYTCVYIRKTFTIDDLSAVPELILSVWYDDGFVAYINGKEVARHDVSGTTGVAVPRTQTASADHEASDHGFENYSLTALLTATDSPFVQGTNVLAIQGLNRTIGSSDFSLRPILYVPRVGPEPARIMHIADGAQWSFFRGRSEPSTTALAWTQFNFAETGWESGPSGFGYGDNDDATVLSDMQNNYVSVYIRRKFTIADLAALTDLRLDVSYDDGFIAYINGKEVARGSVSGTVGQPVAYDNSAAATSHEASGFQSYDLTSLLTDPNTPLHAGENVLALQGINASSGSTDFTLRPTLSSSGSEGSVVQNCGSGLVTTTATLHLSGVASAGAARWVQVNGQTASYLPVSWDNNPLTLSAYTAETPLAIGPNAVEIVALDANFAEVGRRQVNIVRTADTSTPVSGTLAAASNWTAQGGPYHVTADVIVPAGGALNIEPGTSILFDSNAAMIVQGRLLAAGTAAAPIRFQPSACGQTWTGLVFLQAQGESLLDHCEIFDAAAPTYQGTLYAACINTIASSLRVQNSQFERLSAGIIDAAQNSTLVVLNSSFKDIAAGLHAAGSYVYLEGLSVQNVTGAAAAIACEGDVAAQSVIRSCVLNLGAGDGVRLVNKSALVEGNTITAMAGKGIALQGAGSPVVRTNIVAGCPTGIALGDGVTAAISHCTVVGGQVGVDLAEITGGLGGGHANMDSTIIWSPSIAGVRLDGVSSLAATTSDIAGGFAGADNIATNPFFIDAAAGNYYLAPNSPCVGTGTGGTDMGALPASGNPVLKVVINEWMAKNTLISDPQGEKDDWFELYNPGATAVNLGGLYLSDHINNPGLWRIPTGTIIPAKGFLLFWADRDVTDTPGLHADFALDIGGEEIGLYLYAGNAYHTIDRVTFGPQTADVSMGRTTDGSAEIAFLPTPTPGRSNNPAPPLSNGGTLTIVTPPRYVPGVETPIRVELRTPYGEVDKDVWTGTIQLSAYPTDVVVTPNTLEVLNGMASGEITLSATGAVRLTATYGERQATVEVTGLSAPSYTTASGTLAAGTTTWGPANGIVRVNGDLTIPAGATLNLQPGTMVQLAAGVSLNVTGTLQSAGTLAAPVIITAADTTAPWGQMLCSGSTSTTTFNYTFLCRGGDSPTVGHTTSGPTIRGSGGATLHFADSSFIDEFGKGMYLEGCHLTLDRCLLSRMVMGMEIVNTDAAIADSFYLRMEAGGDVTDHDALYFNGSGAMSAKRTVFAYGGDDGIDTLSSNPTIERCILYGQEDKGISMYTGTIRIRDSLILSTGGTGVSAKGNNTDVYLDNTTIYNVPIGIQARDKFGEPNNIIRYFVNNCIVWAATQTVQTDYAAAYITISNSLLDPSVPWGGTGNLYVDPQFRNPVARDFRLNAGSPGINSGDAAFVPVAGEADLDGRSRVLGGRVDRGAYEFAAVYGDGDADGDGDVDMADFAHFQLCVTGNSGAAVAFECRDVDFNADGRVNGDDLLLFAKCFQGPTVLVQADCAKP